MSEMLLFPVFIYLVNSMSGVIYTRNFLKEEYDKRILFNAAIDHAITLGQSDLAGD